MGALGGIVSFETFVETDVVLDTPISLIVEDVSSFRAFDALNRTILSAPTIREKESRDKEIGLKSRKFGVDKLPKV